MTSKSPVRSCEDVDEQVLSYAEVKALCAGNPLIKEKTNLEVEVAKLKVLKADHQSQRYRLEDRLLKDFPASIQYKQSEIAASAAGCRDGEGPTPRARSSCGIEIRGMHFDDKLAAGERLLAACQEMPSAEAVTLGSYRGFGLDLQFDSFRNEYQAILRGETSHFVSLGTDARGNLTRIDNALDQPAGAGWSRQKTLCRPFTSSGTRPRLSWKSLSRKRKNWPPSLPVWPSWTPCSTWMPTPSRSRMLPNRETVARKRKSPRCWRS